MECCAEVILPCPYCGSAKTFVKENCAGYAVICGSCGGVGPGESAEDCAVQRWNSKAALAASFRQMPDRSRRPAP